ncbi:protein suppressor of underreplication [Eurosta solidaginis]|uniref:protein suppressor of underreplication n=1 Tax=Eurosta solidaginis TaxID=178769 RepID=UPI0035311867
MYHFLATCAPEPLELSESVHIPAHIRQYLRDFQVDTLNFLHKHLANGDCCILNDESGLGKCVSTAVYLGVIAKNKRTLIVAQNDDELVAGWQFHFEVLTNLSVGVLAANTSSLDLLPNIIIAKWATLRTNIDVSKYNFDYVIVDNRGELLNNNFCMSMLMSNYERKVNLVVSSVDVTSDLKLLHNCLRLGGHLEHQYEQFKYFEAKYKLPNSKDVLNKTADLEQYFLKREMLSDYCKDFRLRRYRYQYEDQLPLVDVERYQISLELWRTVSSSNSSQRSNDNTNNVNANSETATEELFNQALALDREVTEIIQSRQNLNANFGSNEASEEAMSPLLIDSESCSSDEPVLVNIANPEPTLNQEKQTEPDIYEFVDLSMDQNSDEYARSAAKLDKQIPNECQIKPRSPIQICYNQKTFVENYTKKVDNVIELTENQISDKTTDVDSSKDTSAKKTKDQSEKCEAKINDSATSNTTCSTENQKQTVRKSIKPTEFAKTRKSVDAKIESNKMGNGIATRRRRANQAEQISGETTKKIKPTVAKQDVSTNKSNDLMKEKLKTGLNKQKSGDVDANTNTSNKISPAKRATINHGEATNAFEAKNKKDHSCNKIDVENKEKTAQSKDNKVTNNQRKLRLQQQQQLRQLREDKTEVKKNTEPAKKSTRSFTIITAMPSSNSVKIQVKDNITTNNTNSTEMRKSKDSPKNRSRPEIPQTPTSRSTRSMQRLTRSADNTKSKYMRAALILYEDRKQKKRRTKPSTREKQEDEDSKSLNTGTNECCKSKNKDKPARDKREENDGTSSSTEEAIVKKKSKVSKTENENSGEVEKKNSQTQNSSANKQNCVDNRKKPVISTDFSLLPCSQYTEDMQCGQKLISDTHSDNGFLRPPTPVRLIRNSEHKHFLSTPSGIADSEVVFVPPTDTPNKTQPVVILSSSTDDGSYSTQTSVQSRRTRALKQNKAVKRTEADRSERTNGHTSSTPTFGELLAKQRIQRKSPDIFSASTDFGLTCTQQGAAADGQEGETETFQGFKIFGSEVKQIQQQHAKPKQRDGKASIQVLSRGRSCLNILEKMFDTTDGTDNHAHIHLKSNKVQQTSKNKPDTKLVKRKLKISQPVVPILPNIITTTNAIQLPQQTNDNQSTKSKQKQNNISKNPIITGSMVDEEIFEITNNDAFGSVMRINSNGEISPVQTAIRAQQQTQHNKITNYLIGSSTQLTPTEVTTEERTPNKRTQVQLSGTVTRRSPKNRSTQMTKLTKWFQKNDVSVNDNQSIAEHDEIRLAKHTRSAMAKRLKRRCLELSFKN